jgi:hypothetical protein
VGRVNTASTEQLTSIQQQVLIGTLLGDGRLESRSKNGSARLRVHHGDSQKEYLIWKYGIFRNVATREPWKNTWIGNQTGNTYSAWFFHTKTLINLGPFHQLFYPFDKKIVPKNIGAFLTPMALATWFMDDGCAFKGSIILNTHCFSVLEQTILQKWFRMALGVETKLHKDRLSYRLFMNKPNAERFLEVIESYIPDCMQRKITPRND